jgi:hypothetical protein
LARGSLEWRDSGFGLGVRFVYEVSAAILQLGSSITPGIRGRVAGFADSAIRRCEGYSG